MSNTILLWVAFNAVVIFLLIIDLGVFQRKEHEIKIKEALLLSAFWIVLSLVFNAFIYYWKGKTTALEFLAGYLIEKSLSVDNLFVFVMIFSYFKVQPRYQHRILFFGILGALVMRAFFIMTGVALLHLFHWIIYVFGAFLVFTGIKMVAHKETEIHPEDNPVIKVFRKIMPVAKNYGGGKFFIKEAGKRAATPLFIVLLTVEATDLIFAMDSIPAILAISRDPFIVYSSNVCAILGLRALYFALAGIMPLFHYLNYGLSCVLVFVGVKMLVSDIYKIPIGIALGGVAGILAVSVLASVFFPKKEELVPPPTEGRDG